MVFFEIMKRFFYLLVIGLTAFSCGEEIEFNTPAIQANRDGRAWRADYFAADIDFGGFIFEGGRPDEVLQLITPTDEIGIFDLSSESSAVAIFQDFDGTIYSTANLPDPSISPYPGEGQIRVLEIDNDADPKRISGEFYFTAFSEDGLKSVNFIRGVFNRVPLTGGLVAIGNENTCLQASQSLNTVQQAFSAADTSDPNYADLCGDYKVALQNAIDACGDLSGSFQATIDSLGDCN